jgi:hypothetical protein
VHRVVAAWVSLVRSFCRALNEAAARLKLRASDVHSLRALLTHGGARASEERVRADELLRAIRAPPIKARRFSLPGSAHRTAACGSRRAA